MTRRGSVAYYSSALILGALFTVVFVRLGDFFRKYPVGGSLLDLFVAALVAGGFTILVSALLIRLIAIRLGWREWWQWLMLGGATMFAVSGVVLLLAEKAYQVARWTMILTMGPVMAWDRAPWALFPAGAATALVLRRIYLVFEKRG